MGELWMLWWGLGLLVVVGLLRIWGHWGGGWAVASTALLAVGVGLAASLVYALLDPNIPKSTSQNEFWSRLKQTRQQPIARNASCMSWRRS